MSNPNTPVETPARTSQPRRRRYLLTAILFLVLAAGAMAGVWTSMPDKYEVKGFIRVKPYIPPVLTPTDLTGILPMYDSFVDLQVSLLQSQRVQDHASNNPEWKALGLTTPRWGSKIPAEYLTVAHPRNSEIITVSYIDPDPKVAAIAVNSIIKAYEITSRDTEDTNSLERLRVLEDLRKTLTNQKHVMANQILALANEFGTDELLIRYRSKLEQQNQLEFALLQVTLDIAMAKAASSTSTQRSPVPESPVPATGTANNRFSLQELLAREASIRNLLEQLQADTKALGQKDLQIRKLKTEHDAISKKIDEVVTRIDQFNLEATIANRIIILSTGETPTDPLPNKRHALMLTAALLGVAAAALTLLRARRHRS